MKLKGEDRIKAREGLVEYGFTYEKLINSLLDGKEENLKHGTYKIKNGKLYLKHWNGDTFKEEKELI